jgi:hypothetical protein
MIESCHTLPAHLARRHACVPCQGRIAEQSADDRAETAGVGNAIASRPERAAIDPDQGLPLVGEYRRLERWHVRRVSGQRRIRIHI